MILSSSHVKVDRPLFLLCHVDTILLMGGRALADNVATGMTALISCDMKVILKILGFFVTLSASRETFVRGGGNRIKNQYITQSH